MDPFDLRQWPSFPRASYPFSDPPVIDQVVIDSRRIHSPHALFVALKGSRSDGHQFVGHAAAQGAKYALVRKGHPPCPGIQLLHVENPLKAFQEIAQCYRENQDTQVICVAGSYGKTMVKDLLYAILEKKGGAAASPESFNSQIGVPLSLLQITNRHQVAVIEAGFSLHGETALLAQMIQPASTIITHLGNKHSLTLGSLEETARELSFLLPKESLEGWTLAPKHPLLLPYLHKETYFWNQQSSVLPHAIILPDGLRYEIIFPNGSSFHLPLKIGKSYFLDLVNLAIKPAFLLGIPPEQIIETISNYFPEPMRTEIWATPLGATVINESYSSDPQSIDFALRHFEMTPPHGKKIFLFGDIRNGNEQAHQRIGVAIAQVKPDHLSVYGRSSFSSLIHEVSARSPQTNIVAFDSLEKAINHHKPFLRPGDTLLIKGAHKPPFEQITEAFQGSIFANQCFIHLAAIASNLKIIRSQLHSNTRIMAMVKAFAYGTSYSHMTRFLASQGIDLFGVSYVDEAIALRREGIVHELFVLNAAPYEVGKVVESGFQIAVSDSRMVSLLQNESKKGRKKTLVHLHVDTGMSRLGCRPEEALEMAQAISQSDHLFLEGIMTHFACADLPEEDSFTLRQAEKFDGVIRSIEKKGIAIPWKHASNSSGTIRFGFPQYNMVRLGLGFYGLAGHGSSAISLTSQIVGINRCGKGETISYGRSYTVKKEQERIAVIPIGYFDGIHIHYSGKGEVMIHGMKAPVTGRVCMDFLMADVTHIPQAAIGDPVLIFGEDEQGRFLSPIEFAKQGGTNVYELITCLGPRIQRVFIHEEDHRMY